MANTAHPTKSCNVLADGYLVKKADGNPVVRRFLDAYLKLEMSDRLAVDTKLEQIKQMFDGLGPVSAVELLMYAMEWRAAAHAGPNRRRALKLLHLGHALEQGNWPPAKRSGGA